MTKIDVLWTKRTWHSGFRWRIGYVTAVEPEAILIDTIERRERDGQLQVSSRNNLDGREVSVNGNPAVLLVHGRGRHHYISQEAHEPVIAGA